MPFVTAKPTKRIRPQWAADPYSRVLRAERDPQIDVYQFPTGSLAGFAGIADSLEDLADGGTGIAFFDENISAIRKQADEAALAAKITAVCSLMAGLASLLLLVRTGGRGQ